MIMSGSESPIVVVLRYEGMTFCLTMLVVVWSQVSLVVTYCSYIRVKRISVLVKLLFSRLTSVQYL